MHDEYLKVVVVLSETLSIIQIVKISYEML